MPAPSPEPPTVAEFATLGGTRLTLGGHNPFLLDGQKSAWIVASGQVDLFAVPLKEGRPAGARRHLLEAGPGDVLLGMPRAAGPDGTTIGVLAVGGLGAEAIALDRSRLERLGAKRLAAVTERWVTALTAMIVDAGTVWADRLVPAAGEVRLRSDDRLYGHPRRITWLKPRSGRVQLLDAGATDGLLPLTGPAWVRAPDEATLEVAATEEVIAAGTLWPALDRFHAAIIELVVRRQRAEADEERVRLLRQTEARAKISRGGYGRLASLLVPRHRLPVAAAVGAAPMQTVFELVAGAIGVQATIPRDGLGADGNAARVARLAAASRLHFRWVALRDDWWRAEHGPLLCFRGESLSPVALLPRGAGRYEMIDPATEERRIVGTALAAELAREAVTLYRPMPATAITVPELIRFGARGAGRDLALVVAMGFSVAMLALFVPVLTGYLFGKVIPQTNRGELYQMAIGLVAIALGSTAFQATQAIALLRFEGWIDWQLQSSVFGRLLALPAPFFKAFTSGDLSDRALGLQAVRAALTGATLTAILSTLFSMVSFGLLLFYSGQLSLYAGGLLAVSLAITLALSYARLRHERDQTRQQGRVDGLVVQFLIGIAKLRVAASEHRALAIWARLFAAQKERFVAGRRWANWLSVFEAAFPVFATLVLFAAASQMMADAALNPPPPSPDGTPPSPPFSTSDFLAFNAAFGQLMTAMTGLATALTSALTVIPLFERSRPILATSPETASGRNPPGELSGEIELSQVTFRYQPDGPPTLDRLSLRIEPGQFVAVVGPSGSGKSTIFRLLLGFEQPESGGVFYDGKALSTLDNAAVRRQIGVVLQNGRITAGTIFSNIVGSTKMSEEDARVAARMAGLDADIEAMPMGMHTVVQEGGGTLSGGQRQRLMVARALIRKPRILLLDEATSALDNRTQATVTESLTSLNTTRVVIAHRLSTIVGVDRIFVIADGKLAQSGTFAELSTQPGPFAELARRQLV